MMARKRQETVNTHREKGNLGKEEREKEIDGGDGEGDSKSRKNGRLTTAHGKGQPQRGGQAALGREGHVLLHEDLHQVDVAAGGCSVQGCPQLIVLGVHVCTMGKQQFHDFFKVVNAALGGTQRWQSEARHGPAPW